MSELEIGLADGGELNLINLENVGEEFFAT